MFSRYFSRHRWLGGVALSGLLMTASCAFAATEERSLPDVPALLARVRDHQDALEKIRENYTFTANVTDHELDKRGVQKKQESKTYDVTFVGHRTILRQTALNGKTLSAADQAKEDARIEKLIRDLTEGKKSRDPDAEHQMKIGVLLRAEHFKNGRREKFRNRDVIVFDFEPDSAFKPSSDYEKFYTKMAGTMWVDEADLQVARVDFTLIDDFKIGGGMFFDMKKGAHFAVEQDRFFNEIWLPISSSARFGARAVLFYNFGIEETATFSGYHQFRVSTEEKISAPAN